MGIWGLIVGLAVGFGAGCTWALWNLGADDDANPLPARTTTPVEHVLKPDHRAPSRYATRRPDTGSRPQVPHHSDGGRP